jgi:hypothetical protein
MNEHDEDVICLVRESFDGLSMDTQVENVFARSRARRRRRSGLTAAVVAATAAAAAGVTLTLGAPAPALSGSVPSGSVPSANPGPVTLAAFSVRSGPGDNTTVTLRKGAMLDPDALRADLARHGISALVTVGTFCRSMSGAPDGLGQVLHPSTAADGSDVIVIDGQAMPPGAELSIGYFTGHIQMALVEKGASLTCSSGTSGSTSEHQVVHLLPSGTPIRGGAASDPGASGADRDHTVRAGNG